MQLRKKEFIFTSSYSWVHNIYTWVHHKLAAAYCMHLTYLCVCKECWYEKQPVVNVKAANWMVILDTLLGLCICKFDWKNQCLTSHQPHRTSLDICKLCVSTNRFSPVKTGTEQDLASSPKGLEYEIGGIRLLYSSYKRTQTALPTVTLCRPSALSCTIWWLKNIILWSIQILITSLLWKPRFKLSAFWYSSLPCSLF